MRRYEALVVAVAWLLLAASARAAGAPAVEPCATHSDVLGLSRIVEIDTANGPHFGHSQRTGEFDFLGDQDRKSVV